MPSAPESGFPAEHPSSERRARRWVVRAGIGLGVLLTVLFVVFSVSPASEQRSAVGFESALRLGEDPFFPVFPETPAQAPDYTEGPPPAESGRGQGPVIEGGMPGLYGGTRDDARCDRQRMLEFLRANPDKAAAWVAALNADPSLGWRGGVSLSIARLGEYFEELTPVVLRADTRVTNHGFAGGQATPRQSVLQRRTYVLIDRYGVPRVRCACGNPLRQAIEAVPVYTGPAWPGFDSSTEVTVRPGAAMKSFTLVEVSTNQPTNRTTGQYHR
ncbi:MAG: DUF6777 domain-containing protein [Egibacteraceae bacterium]